MTFEEYWGDEPSPGRITAKDAWTAGQKAERERIKQIVDDVYRQGTHLDWLEYRIAVVERIEDVKQ